MIGIVNRRIFEFRDYSDLAYSLGWLGNKYNCDVLFVTEKKGNDNVIAGIIDRGEFIQFTPNLDPDKEYRIFGAKDFNLKKFELDKGSKIPNIYWTIEGFKFSSGAYRVPTEIDI